MGDCRIELGSVVLRLMVAALLLAICGASGGIARAAEMAPTAQARSIEGTFTHTSNFWLPTSNFFFPDFDPPDKTVSVPNGPNEFTATGFDPFGPSMRVVDLAPAINGWVEVEQTSTIAPYRIAASGAYEAQLDAHAAAIMPPLTPYNFVVVSSDTDALSTFSTTFTLDERTVYHLSGEVAHTASEGPFLVSTSGRSRVRLEGPGGATLHEEVFDCLQFCLGGSQTFSFEGTLPAGTYTIEASVAGEGTTFCLDVIGLECFEPTGSGSFSFQLSIAGEPIPTLAGAGRAMLAGVLLAAGALVHLRLRLRLGLGLGLGPAARSRRSGCT